MDTTTLSATDLESIARQLQLQPHQCRATVELLDEGNTVPFITRYRKDRTGGLDEEQIRQIREAVEAKRQLNDRRERILRSIQSQGLLTPELEQKIHAAGSLKILEDLYLPFRPKKQTLATVARQRGLEPLAQEILRGDPASQPLETLCNALIDPEQQLPTTAEVLLGVGHILAEMFSERSDLRSVTRRHMWGGKIVSKRIEGTAADAALDADADQEDEEDEHEHEHEHEHEDEHEHEHEHEQEQEHGARSTEQGHGDETSTDELATHDDVTSAVTGEDAASSGDGVSQPAGDAPSETSASVPEEPLVPVVAAGPTPSTDAAVPAALDDPACAADVPQTTRPDDAFAAAVAPSAESDARGRRGTCGSGVGRSVGGRCRTGAAAGPGAAARQGTSPLKVKAAVRRAARQQGRAAVAGRRTPARTA